MDGKCQWKNGKLGAEGIRAPREGLEHEMGSAPGLERKGESSPMAGDGIWDPGGVRMQPRDCCGPSLSQGRAMEPHPVSLPLENGEKALDHPEISPGSPLDPAPPPGSPWIPPG